MKNLILVLLFVSVKTFSQNVGIGTTTPLARLHVTDSSVLFQGATDADQFTAINPPFSGYGVRMMWYPQKAAFRVGTGGFDGWKKDNIGINSFASGFDTWASGAYSSSMGYNSYASGQASFAAGYMSAATNFGSLALGTSNQVSGSAAFAAGNTNVVAGFAGVGMGGSNRSYGYSGIAIGNNNEQRDFYSVAIGSNNVAIAQYAMSLGDHATSRGYYATCVGYDIYARGAQSIVMGHHNDTADFPNATNVAGSDRLFQLGNGSTFNRTNAMTVLQNGYVGLGIVNPVTKLDIAGQNAWDLTNTEGDFRIGNSSYRLKIGVALAGGGAGAATIRSAGGIERLNLGANNTNLLTLNGASLRVGIGTETPSEKLEVIGNVKASSFITTSDVRLKKNILPLQNSLSLLIQLNGYSYNWKDESIDAGLQSGLIAQEVQKIFPHLVKQSNDGSLAVNYTGLIPVMIESIKTQQAEIEELKKIVCELLNKTAK